MGYIARECGYKRSEYNKLGRLKTVLDKNRFFVICEHIINMSILYCSYFLIFLLFVMHCLMFLTIKFRLY